jgi:hypothetical protein
MNSNNSINLPISPCFLCPYLGMRYDADTFSAEVVFPNFCHKAMPEAPVSLERQQLTCLSEEFKNCPVFIDSEPHSLPAEWINIDAFEEIKEARQQRFFKLILIIATIVIVSMISILIIYRGLLTGSETQNSVAQISSTPWLNHLSTATLSSCTVQILAPVYSPPVLHPPLVVIYGFSPFLVKWTVTNTSADCVWSTIKLLTTLNGQPRTLNMMPTNRSLPVIDEEFAIFDKNNQPLTQVDPGQKVTFSIQIGGLDLLSSDGKIVRFYDMLVNGQSVPSGKLIVYQEQWVSVTLPTETRTQTITIPPTVTPTIVIPATVTPTFVIFPTMVLPTETPTMAPPNPVLPTRQPPTVAPPATPTLRVPPIVTSTLPNP